MKNPLKLKRRSFLVGLGGASLTIPLLRSLTPSADAQELPTKNFLSYQIKNGHFGQHWYPSDAATTGDRGLQLVEENVREMRLSDIDGPISDLLDERFDPFREKMTLMRHIDRLDHSNHQYANGLFGWHWHKDDIPNGFYRGLPPSIDQLMATHVFQGAMSPLNITVSWRETASCSVSVNGEGNLSYGTGLNPRQAFERLFADFGLEPDVADRRRAYRRSIVDRVLPHYREVRGNTRLSRADGHLLDEHIEHMDALQRQISVGVGACAVPGTPGDMDLRDPENVNPAAQAGIDVGIAAVRCGLARVVNFLFDPNTRFSMGIHGCDHHHGASHDDDASSVQQIKNVHDWHMDQISEILTQLDNTPSGSGTLLDDSLFFLNNEIGNQSGPSGNSGTDVNHIGVDIQTMFVGSAGGALRTGLFMDYRTDFERTRWSKYIGTAYNRVLVTCMLAMGMTPDQWEVDGQPGYGSFRGARYDKTPLDQVVSGDKRGMRDMLPRLAV